MHILVVGSRKPQNAADDGLLAFRAAGHEIVFVVDGKHTPFDDAVLLDREDPVGQITGLVRDRAIDVLYFRGEWFDYTFTHVAEPVFAHEFGVPKVFGYHCHTAQPNAREAFAFERADGLVLLNRQAEEYVRRSFGVTQPCFLLPSLFLPQRSWYACQERPKLSSRDGQAHCVIPSAAIRLGGLPATPHPLVPIENALCDRYDYYQVLRLLAARDIHAHVYGSFVTFGAGGADDAAHVEAVYRRLESVSPHVHFEGKVKSAVFAEALSQYDFAILTGYLPGQWVPPFEHMNYQLRLNSVLAAGLPVFVAKGTGEALEQEILRSGAGCVFEHFDQVRRCVRDRQWMQAAAEAVVAARDDHCMDTWVEPMVGFFESVIARHGRGAKAAMAQPTG